MRHTYVFECYLPYVVCVCVIYRWDGSSRHDEIPRNVGNHSSIVQRLFLARMDSVSLPAGVIENHLGVNVTDHQVVIFQMTLRSLLDTFHF